jgi:hypothetical protein
LAPVQTKNHSKTQLSMQLCKLVRLSLLGTFVLVFFVAKLEPALRVESCQWAGFTWVGTSLASKY